MITLFTAENAAEMQKRAQVAIARKKAAKEELERLQRIAAVTTAGTNADARKAKVENLLDRMLDDMLQAEDGLTRARIASSMDKVWNLLYPRAGALKPKGMGRTGARPVPMATQTPVPVQYMTTTVPN